MKSALTFILIGILSASCHQRSLSKLSFYVIETPIFTLNSVIEGKLIQHFLTNKDENKMCSKHPCTGDIEILKILQNGQNYHGQFEVGDTIPAHFEFTLDNTNKIFPHLNAPLPGLHKNEIFRAELFEKDGTDDYYSIQLYEVILKDE